MNHRSPGLFVTGTFGSLVWLFDGFTLWLAIVNEDGRLMLAGDYTRNQQATNTAYRRRRRAKEAA